MARPIGDDALRRRAPLRTSSAIRKPGRCDGLFQVPDGIEGSLKLLRRRRLLLRLDDAADPRSGPSRRSSVPRSASHLRLSLRPGRWPVPSVRRRLLMTKVQSKCRKSDTPLRSVISWTIISGRVRSTARVTARESSASASTGSAPSRRIRPVFCSVRMVPTTSCPAAINCETRFRPSLIYASELRDRLAGVVQVVGIA
jgi:hypothetical protein